VAASTRTVLGASQIGSGGRASWLEHATRVCEKPVLLLLLWCVPVCPRPARLQVSGLRQVLERVLWSSVVRSWIFCVSPRICCESVISFSFWSASIWIVCHWWSASTCRRSSALF
jgi:hypothetical protein